MAFNQFLRNSWYHDVHKQIKRTFIDGIHSNCNELSWFNRPTERGSQPMEAFNRCKNAISSIETKGGRPTIESYLEVAKSLEKQQLGTE